MNQVSYSISENQDPSLKESFLTVYTKFKLRFYSAVFCNEKSREHSLSAIECFCMETILALDSPTINQFASFVNISQPNAAYKIQNLINKGYLAKIKSTTDKREHYLQPTSKYLAEYNVSYSYLNDIFNRMEEKLSIDERQALNRALTVLSDDLMPEIPAYITPVWATTANPEK